MNKNSTKQLVVLMIIAFTTMTTLFAADRCEYLSPRIYLGIDYGHSVVEEQEVPNVGITVGSKLSSRTSTEIFARIEPLSNFPGENFGVDITETEATFAFSSGLAVTARMFHDAACDQRQSPSPRSVRLHRHRRLQARQRYLWARCRG
ncbi:MAG: hypothetical protein M0P41_10015 [Sphaerochaeta sp.]|nr:hypothetical protein [Sphaerochaeta sp.]